MTPAVFLDRDGTLNAERGFVRSAAELTVLPAALPALRRLAAAGFKLIVVTNQSGIARGLYSEADLAATHAALQSALDGLPDAYLHCPHHPADGVNGYGRECRCRKPGPGLIEQAARLFDLDLARSHVVGDAARDLLMTRDFPVQRILVRSGKPWERELATLRANGIEPEGICDDIGTAADVILARAHA